MIKCIICGNKDLIRDDVYGQVLVCKSKDHKFRVVLEPKYSGLYPPTVWYFTTEFSKYKIHYNFITEILGIWDLKHPDKNIKDYVTYHNIKNIESIKSDEDVENFVIIS